MIYKFVDVHAFRKCHEVKVLFSCTRDTRFYWPNVTSSSPGNQSHSPLQIRICLKFLTVVSWSQLSKLIAVGNFTRNRLVDCDSNRHPDCETNRPHLDCDTNRHPDCETNRPHLDSRELIAVGDSRELIAVGDFT